MLLYLSDFFNSVPFRGFLAFFLALILALSFGGKLINFLHHHQAKGQPIREDGPQSHLLTKKGTPTMGGLLILGSYQYADLRRSAQLFCLDKHFGFVGIWLNRLC